MRRRSMLWVSAAAAAPTAAPLRFSPQVGLAQPASADDDWLDADRDRVLPLRLRWPAGDGPYALVAIGASGHAFGAVTVQALAGQRFPVATTGIVEPRFKAFVAFSPSPGQGLAVAESLAVVTRPFLAITGSHDTDPLGRGLTSEGRASVYGGLPRGQRALLWLDGADHMSFGGNAAQRLRARAGLLRREPLAAEREPQHHRLIAAISSLWWRAKLLDDPQAAAALRTPAGLAGGDRWQQD